jgi:hypothetical protein
LRLPEPTDPWGRSAALAFKSAATPTFTGGGSDKSNEAMASALRDLRSSLPGLALNKSGIDVRLLSDDCDPFADPERQASAGSIAQSGRRAPGSLTATMTPRDGSGSMAIRARWLTHLRYVLGAAADRDRLWLALITQGLAAVGAARGEGMIERRGGHSGRSLEYFAV